MGQFHTREIVLLPSTTATTNGVGADMVLPQAFQAAIISVATTAASGTSPTLNVVVQNKLGQAASTDLAGNFPSGTAIYDDFLGFSQMTTTGTTRICRLVSGDLQPSPNTTVVTSADYLNLDGTITAGNMRTGPICGLWRVKFVIAGTSPSFTFSVTAQMIPFST